MADNKKQLVYNIAKFLEDSITDGTIKEEDSDGIQVAVECISSAFNIDLKDAEQESQYSVKPSSLQAIFDVYVKTKAKSATKAPAASTPAPAPKAEPTAEDKAKAEQLKTAGNSLMSKKQYDEAIAKYTEAIALVPSSPVYYSNRAAAYSSTNEHQKAVDDAEMALKVDPAFSKAYSRLGHAHYSLGDFPSAVESYEKGLLLDPTNTNFSTGLTNAKARLPSSSTRSATGDDDAAVSPRAGAGSGAPGGGAGGMPDLASMMNMFGGAGGGGGGMPDLASLMNNPQMMAMAQQMMQNGGLDQIMNNPAIRSMAERMQSGGGMPSMSEMMNDPSIMDAARAFQQGQNRGA